MGKKLLTYEELKLLQRKWLPDVHSHYRDVNDFLNIINESESKVDGLEIYRDDKTQREVYKLLMEKVNALELAVNEMKSYVEGVSDRIGENKYVLERYKLVDTELFHIEPKDGGAGVHHVK